MERERFTSLIKESVLTLCRNGLLLEGVKSVEGLLGITLKSNEVFLINIKDSFETEPTAFQRTSCEKDEKDLSLTQKRKYGEDLGAKDGNHEPSFKRSCYQKLESSSARQLQKAATDDSSEEQVSSNISSLEPEDQIYDHCPEDETLDERGRGNSTLSAKQKIKDEPSSPDRVQNRVVCSGEGEQEATVRGSGSSDDVEILEAYEQKQSNSGSATGSELPPGCLPLPPLDFLHRGSSLVQYPTSVLTSPHLPSHRPVEEDDMAAVYAFNLSQTSGPFTIEGETFLGSHTGPWNCFVRNCNYTSKRKYNLERHIRLVHQGIREECQECGKKFSDVTGLRQHRLSVHGHQGFSCPHCDMVFDYKTLQKEHIQQAHSSNQENNTKDLTKHLESDSVQ